MFGEGIEGRLDLLLVGEFAGIGVKPFEKGAAERIASEEPVQVAPGDSAVAADAAVKAVGKAEHRSLEFHPGRVAEMHLVPFDRHAGRKVDTGSLDEALDAAEDGIDVKQPESLDGLLP